MKVKEFCYLAIAITLIVGLPLLLQLWVFDAILEVMPYMVKPITIIAGG